MKSTENDRIDLQVQVATLYYKENLSQQEIATKLSLSRPTISRILKESEENGIVSIRIKNISSKQHELAEKVKIKYGLTHVSVVSTNTDSQKVMSDLGRETADYLETVIDSDIRLGVSSGSTLAHIIPFLHPIHGHNIDVYQLMGDANHQMDTSSSFLTTEIAKAMHATPHALHVPLMVHSKVLRDLLLEEPCNRRHFEDLDNIDVAIAGIGNIESLLPTTCDVWLTIEEDKEKLREKKVVGDISGNSVDESGKFCVSDISMRTITIFPEQWMKVKNRVAMACGKEKVEIAKALLKGNLITSFIIDETIAASLLS